MKTCSYCHSRPRRPNSPYCSDRCENRKHLWNVTHSHHGKESRIRKTEQERIEARRIYQHEYNTLREVRRLLREMDDAPLRLRPEQKIRMWNLITDEIRIVEV